MTHAIRTVANAGPARVAVSMPSWEDRMTPRPVEKPRQELVQRCWRLKTSTGKVFTCGIFREMRTASKYAAAVSRESSSGRCARQWIVEARRIAEAQRLGAIGVRTD